MRITGLFTRSKTALPGITGTARVDRRPHELLRRVGPGDIAVLDQTDLDRATADALVRADVAAVINGSPSISGRFPNLGPKTLLGAGIALIDDVGRDVLHRIKDGSSIRVHNGAVYVGERHVATGMVQTPRSVANQMSEARAGMATQLEAFSANTIEFLKRERSLILDGMGIPGLQRSLRNRHVLVVAPGGGHTEDLRQLKKYLSRYTPVLIGVDSGADALHALGYTPDVIVGDPRGIEPETLTTGAEVIVPAQLDGHAPGAERIRELSITAVTFPATGNPEDLALLLADAHGADLVVTVGFQATLHEFLDYGRSGSNPSTFLTRLKLGPKLVDGKSVAELHRSRGSIGTIALLALAVLAVVIVAQLLSGSGDAYWDQTARIWNSVTSWFGGLIA